MNAPRVMAGPSTLYKLENQRPTPIQPEQLQNAPLSSQTLTDARYGSSRPLSQSRCRTCASRLRLLRNPVEPRHRFIRINSSALRTHQLDLTPSSALYIGNSLGHSVPIHTYALTDLSASDEECSLYSRQTLCPYRYVPMPYLALSIF